MTILRPAVSTLCLALLLVASAHGAEPLSSIPNPRVKNGTWVTDTSGTLDPKTVALLNERAAPFERDTTSEIAVVVIRAAPLRVEFLVIGRQFQQQQLRRR